MAADGNFRAGYFGRLGIFRFPPDTPSWAIQRMHPQKVVRTIGLESSPVMTDPQRSNSPDGLPVIRTVSLGSSPVITDIEPPRSNSVDGLPVIISGVSLESSPALSRRKLAISYVDAYETVSQETDAYYNRGNKNLNYNSEVSDHRKFYHLFLNATSFEKEQMAVQVFLKKLDKISFNEPHKMHSNPSSPSNRNDDGDKTLTPHLRRLRGAMNIINLLQSFETMDEQVLSDLIERIGISREQLFVLKNELLDSLDMINRHLQRFVIHFHPKAHEGPARYEESLLGSLERTIIYTFFATSPGRSRSSQSKETGTQAQLTFPLEGKEAQTEMQSTFSLERRALHHSLERRDSQPEVTDLARKSITRTMSAF